MNRRHFLATTLGTVTLAAQGRRAPAAEATKPAPAEAKIDWIDARQLAIEGRGWTETARFYDRLPAKAEKMVRGAVWTLSRDSAGMCVRFKTDAPQLQVRYELMSDQLAMPHMPATGVSGVDLYGTAAEGQWRWVGVARPAAKQVEAVLADQVDAADGPRSYMLYLPLYNGVESLEIGVPAGHEVGPLADRQQPIVFYGTSITHGGCASRAGMAYPAVLGRRLDRATINLGFSGNGRMDVELATLLGEVDASIYVIDCLPNMTPELVAERTEPFVRQLRQRRPATPIVLVEDRTFTNADFFAGRRRDHAARRAALRSGYDRLRGSGIEGLQYVEGARLLGDDGEATVDGSHPSDLGMVRLADGLEPALRKALGKE